MKITLLKTISIAAVLMMNASAFAACEINQDGKKSSFDGKNLDGVQVEKKSLLPLSQQYPGLNAIERAKGEVQTCTSCSGKYVICS